MTAEIRSRILLIILLVITATVLVVVIRMPAPGIPDPTADRGTEENPEDIPDGIREEVPPELPVPKKGLYLVLDDAGHNLDDLRYFSIFPGRFTLAVLPGLEFTTQAAHMAHALGHEVILHQPMEPVGSANPGPAAIYVADTDEKIVQTLIGNLDAIPEARGMNNHMGSKVTADPRVMQVIAAQMHERKLFFLDSRTAADSVALAVAVENEVPALSRDVFLDNERNVEAIGVQLDEALAVAESRGFAVMIGHVTSPELADVLSRRYDEIMANGYEFRVLSSIFHEN